MKKLLLIFTLIAALGWQLSANENDKAWDRANTMYINSEYKGAIMLYDSLANAGYESAKLYYNLGNAYFKEGKYGKAILNYRRSENLAPADGDVQYNLGVARSYVKNKIDELPQFFLNRWISALRTSMGSDMWAILSIVFIVVVGAGVLVYLLAEAISLRKSGFALAICFFVLFIVAVCFASVEKRAMYNSSDAVVISSASPVKSSPDRTSKDLFILNEGNEVKVLSSYGEWAEIMIADGNKGWILTTAIEKVGQ